MAKKGKQAESEEVFEGILDEEEEQRGKKIVHAVEAILDSNANIIGISKKAAKRYEHLADSKQRLRASRYIISHYSNRSGISGLVSSLPSLIPGFGKLFTLFGGGIIDAVLVLKYEVEMALCLSALYGHDISDEKERVRAFLMASAAVDSAQASDSRSESLLRVVDLAVNEYSTRELSKMMLKLIAKAALSLRSKQLVRIMPFVGIVVSGALNKSLSHRAGRRCRILLEERLKREQKKEGSDES